MKAEKRESDSETNTGPLATKSDLGALKKTGNTKHALETFESLWAL